MFDFINLMSYDMGTGFSSVSTFNAPLHEVPADPLAPELRRWNNVAGAVQYYREHGVPADKLVLGVPFYGRGFRSPAMRRMACISPQRTGRRRRLAGDQARYLDQPGWVKHWQTQAQSPWLYNAVQKIFISYEDPRSIGLRARFAREQGLAGVFMWELTGDDEQASLLNAMLGPWQKARIGD